MITTGEGGMIAVHDPDVAERLRRLRQHAMDVSDLARHSANDIVVESYPERGWNARMTDMQAALGLCQLELLDEVRADRRRLAERYTAALGQISALEPPYEPDYAERTWQSYAVKLRRGVPVTRTELQRGCCATASPRGAASRRSTRSGPTRTAASFCPTRRHARATRCCSRCSPTCRTSSRTT